MKAGVRLCNSASAYLRQCAHRAWNAEHFTKVAISDKWFVFPKRAFAVIVTL